MKNHFALDGLELEHPEPESIELDSHWLKIIIPIHSFLGNHFALIGMMEQLLERERLNFESIELDSHWLKIIILITLSWIIILAYLKRLHNVTFKTYLNG